jgi:hypothetical protein
MKKLLFLSVFLFFITVFASETFAGSGSSWTIHYYVSDLCVCPTLGNWELKPGNNCVLNNLCKLVSGDLFISGGSLYISTTGILEIPSSHKIIIEKVNNSRLAVQPGGKIIINK